MSEQPPPARGARLPWSQLPARLSFALEQWLGSPVVSAVMQPGGFSPGPAARVASAGGRRVFVKAVGPELNPNSPWIHRREARVVAALPMDAPVPRLLWTHDEGDDGWIMLVFEDVEGWNPEEPWRADELDRVIEALVELSGALTPSPIPADPVASRIVSEIHGWQRLRDERPSALDAWSTRHLEALAALEAEAPAAVEGSTLVHLDVRADNVLLTPERVYFVDWPHASSGAAWVDLVFLAPSVAMQGGPDPEALLARHPAAEKADAGAITAAVAALAGYFTRKAQLPPPPGLPTLRAFQAAQGVVTRRWLAERTGWI